MLRAAAMKFPCFALLISLSCAIAFGAAEYGGAPVQSRRGAAECVAARRFDHARLLFDGKWTACRRCKCILVRNFGIGRRSAPDESGRGIRQDAGCAVPRISIVTGRRVDKRAAPFAGCF